MRMLDLFCGRWGWSKAFAARGWECVGIDLNGVSELPANCNFYQQDVMKLDAEFCRAFDFSCASPPCDEFACFGMPHFRKNPPFPYRGVEVFKHTQDILRESGIPHVIENVKSAQPFVGKAEGHAGSFYLWGTAIPPLLPAKLHKSKWFHRPGHPGNFAQELLLPKAERKAILSLIPNELAACVCDYAERLLELRARIAEAL